MVGVAEFQSREYRDVVAGDRPDVIAQSRIERVVELLDRHVDRDLHGRPPPGVGMRPGIGGSADQCDENVQIVGVLHRPGADHRVGEDDRVGFGPGDLLAAGRRVVEQVGGAGVRRGHPEPQVRVGQSLGRFAEFRGDALVPPAAPVDAQGVHARRHRDLAAQLDQPLGEPQTRRALVEAAVDVAAVDVDQIVRALQLRGPDDHPDGQSGGLAEGPGQHLVVVVGQSEIGQVQIGQRSRRCRWGGRIRHRHRPVADRHP